MANRGEYLPCAQGSACPKVHPNLEDLQTARAAWIALRRKERASASQLEGDTHGPQDKAYKAARGLVSLI